MIGVDEVGRGSWAGPLLVVAAGTNTSLPDGLTDSKLLTKQQRQQLYDKLIICCKFGEGWVKAREIDRQGLAGALRLGTRRALASLGAASLDHIIMDGNICYIPKKYKNRSNLIKGDSIVPIISAASIYAKVTRDKYMYKLNVRYPRYGFASNVGYGTKAHISAINNFGYIKYVHRMSYKPLKQSD